MTKFLIFVAIFFINILLGHNQVIAQDNNKDCEELKKEITNLQDLLAKETANLQELTNQLEEQRKLHQKALDAFNNFAKKHSDILGFEEIRTEILEKLATGAEIIRALKNAIDETTPKIQALKEAINNLLNKLANCGKKEKKTAMKEKTSSNNNFLAGNTGNFEVCAGVGYGFSFNGSLLGQNKTFTANDRTFDGVYGSWAQGENFFIKTDFKISDCFGAGVEFDYTYGNNFEFSTNTIGNNPTTINYEGRYTGYSATPFIQFNPCGINRMAPYIDLGLRLNFSNEIKQNIVQTQNNNNITTVTKQGATFKGVFTTGFDAMLGVKYALNRNWALMGELNFSSSNFITSTGTITSYSVNGADQLGSLNTSQKQTNYVKSYTVPNSGFNPNSPSQALRSSQPASMIGARAGVFITFGDYKKGH